MFNLVLTKSTTFIIGPISTLLGKIMEWLYNFFNTMGIANIGLCIILFTIIVKAIMIPLTVKQQKFSKLSAMMNPEIQAVQKKYKGKKDNESMVKMQQETKAVYAKYGTSPTGSCLQLAIQMPILFALYNVIRNVPAYVPKVHSYYENIRNILTDGYITDKLDVAIKNVDAATITNKVIDKLAQFSDTNWSDLLSKFTDSSSIIQTNLDHINSINSFLGMNISQSPWELVKEGVIFAIAIPILAGLSQWFSTRLMTSMQSMNMDDNPMASSMKMMNTTMPIISTLFSFTLPTGLGIYWVASSVFQVVSQVVINAYFNKVDMNDVIKKNVEKAKKKQKRKGVSAAQVSNAANYSTKKIPQPKENTDADKKTNTERAPQGNVKPGSLAAKANMVRQYNDKNNKK